MIPTHAGIIPDRAPQDHLQCTSVPSVNGDLKSPLKVGVFVDEMPQNIITRAVNFSLDIIQLHGHETPTLIRNLRRTLDPDIRPGIKVIKAISVDSRDDLAVCREYDDCVDYFLFDTKCKTVGGSGQHFDWSVLDAYHGEKPFILSGGIGPHDSGRIRDFFSAGSQAAEKCIGIDLNSRFETEPGMKDVAALRRFLSQLSQ